MPPLTGSLLRPRAIGLYVPGEASDAPLALLRVRRQAQAAEAWNRGQAAFSAGDLGDAARWLDRARRIAPGDLTIALVLAMTRLRQGRPDAAQLFDRVLRRHDLRTAWLGLAQAHRLAGAAEEATGALHAALSGHAGPVDHGLAALADTIAGAIGAPGWCAMDEQGRLIARGVGLRVRAGTREHHLDGSTPWVLPAAWWAETSLTVTAGRRALLGSPLALARLRAVEGCVAVVADGIEGWAWHPADPGRDPRLWVIGTPGGRGRVFIAGEAADELSGEATPFARHRRFRLAAEALSAGLVRVVGADGRNLLGSPLEPETERHGAVAAARAAAALHPAAARPTGAPFPLAPSFLPATAVLRGAAPTPGPARPVAVVVPVYRNAALTAACLDSVLATVDPSVEVVVIDDASPEPAMTALLDRLAAARRIRLIRHRRNAGFPASANAGMRACPTTDVVLLNSDTLVAPGWLERLARAAQSAADIGTVTPLSNDATILSYPDRDGGNAVPGPAATRRLAAWAARANGDAVVEIPTAIGFCMYIRRDCLDQVGLFRPELFAQGYGEENDFCLRARHLGWRHVAAPGVFVAHAGGGSFGAARAHLLGRNLALLERLHPGYAALIAAHQALDPLAEARRRLDRVRWQPPKPAPQGGRGAVLLITHDLGGGVQRQVAARIAALAGEGWRPIVLRPDLRRAGWCRIEDGDDASFPNLRFAVPAELPALAAFLAEQRPHHVEVHHLVGHAHDVLALCRSMGLPYEVHVHDWAWFCPRISLIGPERRYCGEPDSVACEACIADAGRNIEEEIGVAALRARSADDLRRAARVVAPSADAASRIARHLPGVASVVVPWDGIRPAARRSAPARAHLDARTRVAVIGAIGTEKGYDVLLACARDAVRRRLPLEFVVIGYTIDDSRLLQTGAVFVTGEYDADELPALIAAQQADFAWLPSIWPETWCFTLSEAWRAGLDVVAFDIGAPAERIRAAGGGLLLPLGLPPSSLNNTLLSRRLALCSTAT